MDALRDELLLRRDGLSAFPRRKPKGCDVDPEVVLPVELVHELGRAIGRLTSGTLHGAGARVRCRRRHAVGGLVRSRCFKLKHIKLDHSCGSHLRVTHRSRLASGAGRLHRVVKTEFMRTKSSLRLGGFGKEREDAAAPLFGLSGR